MSACNKPRGRRIQEGRTKWRKLLQKNPLARPPPRRRRVRAPPRRAERRRARAKAPRRRARARAPRRRKLLRSPPRRRRQLSVRLLRSQTRRRWRRRWLNQHSGHALTRVKSTSAATSSWASPRILVQSAERMIGWPAPRGACQSARQFSRLAGRRVDCPSDRRIRTRAADSLRSVTRIASCHWTDQARVRRCECRRMRLIFGALRLSAIGLAHRKREPQRWTRRSLRAQQGRRFHDIRSRRHRPLLLADPEWVEDFHHARGMRPPLRFAQDQHRPRRAVRAGIPDDFAEQPDPGDRGSKWARRKADLGLRVGRYSAISRAQDRTLLWLERARARGGRGMAVLADGRPWTDVRASQPFPQLCAREGGVWNQPLHQ